MDLMPGNLLRMSFHRFDLSLPVFIGSKGRIRMMSLMQQLRRPLHTHTPLVSANADNMWCMECEWISYRRRLTVFSVPVSLWNPRDGCAAVGHAAGRGGSVCMHPSWSLGAMHRPHRIHGFLT